VGLPIIANGIVYSGSSSGNIYALNASSGAKIWNYAAGPRIDTISSGFVSPQPAIAKGYLFLSSHGGVWCLDASDGTKIWNYTNSNYSYASSSLAYSNGKIYVGSGITEFGSPVASHFVYALDALTGKKVWDYSIGYNIWASPVVVGDVVYVGSGFVTEENRDFEGSGAMFSLKTIAVTVSPPGFLGTSLPLEYGYAIVTVLVTIVVAGLSLVYLKKRRK
jgi:outer membrane protein assembly factor BamB